MIYVPAFLIAGIVNILAKNYNYNINVTRNPDFDIRVRRDVYKYGETLLAPEETKIDENTEDYLSTISQKASSKSIIEFLTDHKYKHNEITDTYKINPKGSVAQMTPEETIIDEETNDHLRENSHKGTKSIIDILTDQKYKHNKKRDTYKLNQQGYSSNNQAFSQSGNSFGNIGNSYGNNGNGYGNNGNSYGNSENNGISYSNNAGGKSKIIVHYKSRGNIFTRAFNSIADTLGYTDSTTLRAISYYNNNMASSSYTNKAYSNQNNGVSNTYSANGNQNNYDRSYNQSRNANYVINTTNNGYYSPYNKYNKSMTSSYNNNYEPVPYNGYYNSNTNSNTIGYNGNNYQNTRPNSTNFRTPVHQNEFNNNGNKTSYNGNNDAFNGNNDNGNKFNDAVKTTTTEKVVLDGCILCSTFSCPTNQKRVGFKCVEVAEYDDY